VGNSHSSWLTALSIWLLSPLFLVTGPWLEGSQGLGCSR
jgi:hypothetical protein